MKLHRIKAGYVPQRSCSALASAAQPLPTTSRYALAQLRWRRTRQSATRWCCGCPACQTPSQRARNRRRSSAKQRRCTGRRTVLSPWLRLQWQNFRLRSERVQQRGTALMRELAGSR
jgi:hypothetical protein